jgi:mRNA interferase MazF
MILSRAMFGWRMSYLEASINIVKPSIVRVSKITTIHGSELIRRLGILHEHDLDRVLHMCRRLF